MDFLIVFHTGNPLLVQHDFITIQSGHPMREWWRLIREQCCIKSNLPEHEYPLITVTAITKL